MLDETYSYYEAPKSTGGWLKGIFMPHTLLEGLGKKKGEIDPNTLINKEDEAAKKKQQSIIYVGIGILVATGLGIGLYYAFKK